MDTYDVINVRELNSVKQTVNALTGAGFTFYNTADQLTNFDKVTMGFISNIFEILSSKGGTGATRGINISQGTSGGAVLVQSSALPYVFIKCPTVNSTSGALITLAGMHTSNFLNGSSGTQLFSSIAPVYNQTSTGGAVDLYINRTETAIGSGQHDFLNCAIAASTKARIDRTGHIFVDATNTAGGTTGNQTINKPSGTVNIAAGAATITVTNNTVTAASIVLAVVRTADATAIIKNVVPSAGSFIINTTANVTGETSIGFVVIN
jgi:hypothetical protein